MPKCTIDCGFGRECGRPGVVEITYRGTHVGWLCKEHSKPWRDKDGRYHDSVFCGKNLIDGFKPV
jgi:hypothetical protein